MFVKEVITVIGLMVGIVYPNVAFSSNLIECHSPKEMQEQILENTEGSRILRGFMGIAATEFMSKLNNTPPVTEYSAERIIVFWKSDSPMVFLTFYRHKCYIGYMSMPRGVFDRLVLGNQRESKT